MADDKTSPAPPSPLSAPAPTRQDLILEAMLTVGEMRKPGYALKVMGQLVAQDDATVTLLRPADAEAENRARAEAIEWLRTASVRARARAAERQKAKDDRAKREKRSRRT